MREAGMAGIEPRHPVSLELPGRCGKGLVDVLADIINVLNPHREADQLGGDATGKLLLGSQLAVGGGCGMDGKALGVAHVGKVAEHLQAFDELATGIGASLDPEDDHASKSILEILGGDGMTGVVLKAGVIDPLHLRVFLEEFGHGKTVLRMAFHAKVKGLDALEEHPRIVGRNARAQVAQGNEPHPQDKGQRGKIPEVVGISKAMVGGIGFIKEGELFILPVEGPTINNEPPDPGSVTPHPFCQGVADNGGTMLDRLEKGGRGEGVVNNEGKVVGLGYVGNGIKIGDGQRRVPNCLDEKSAGFGGDRLGEILGIAGIDKVGLDPELGMNAIEHGVGAAIQVVGRHDFITLLANIDDRVVNGGGPGRKSEPCNPTLQGSTPLFQNISRWVHQPGVNVPKFLEPKQIGRMFSAVENVGGGPVNRNPTGVGGGVGDLTGMDALCVEAELITHWWTSSRWNGWPDHKARHCHDVDHIRFAGCNGQWGGESTSPC